MNYITLTIILFGSMYVTARFGPARTFSTIALPVLLFLGITAPYKIAGIPQFDAISCLGYGVLIGIAISRKFPVLRVHFIDYLIVVLAIIPVISGWINGEFWTAVNSTADRTFWWIVPYMLGRLALSDPVERNRSLNVLCFATPIIGALALFEWRFFPNEVSRMMDRINLSAEYNEMVLKRWAFFRTIVTFKHPIDHGNVGVILLCMIPVLTYMSGRSLAEKRIKFALAGAMLSVMTSMSFTSIFAAMIMGGLFVAFYYQRWLVNALPLVVLSMVLGAFYLTNDLLGRTLIEEQRDLTNALGDSVWIRALIVQRAWELAQVAGWFGFERTITKDQLLLDSVDNSYMLFILRHGWTYFFGWMALIFSITMLGHRLITRTADATPYLRIPAILIPCCLIAILVGMYTVWFGFIYSLFWLILLGMGVTTSQMLDRTNQPPVPLTGYGPTGGFAMQSRPRTREVVESN